MEYTRMGRAGQSSIKPGLLLSLRKPALRSYTVLRSVNTMCIAQHVGFWARLHPPGLRRGLTCSALKRGEKGIVDGWFPVSSL